MSEHFMKHGQEQNTLGQGKTKTRIMLTQRSNRGTDRCRRGNQQGNGVQVSPASADVCNGDKCV